jgi:DNA topoisomerase-3
MPGGGIRVLNVAEKPSVAREASKALSGNSARYVRGRNNTGCWEFQHTVRGTPCTMAFTSVAGHLMSTDFQEPFNKWMACSPLELYSKPLRRYVPSDKRSLEENLEAEARKAQWLILWLDCDREGEHICFEVMDVCLGANARLKVMRAQFSTLLRRDLQHALDHLREPNQNEAHAVDARQEIDLRSGASFTRFLTLSVQKKFDWTSNLGPKNENPVISYGPCQFPTLGFIVKRQWEIYAHIPEEFWYIHVVYRDDQARSICEFEWARKRLFDKFAAELFFQPCSQVPVTARVEQVLENPKFRFPPHPLSTIEFAKRASSFLRIGSQDAMKIAEQLYQAGFISYPRTETDVFSTDFDLRSIAAEQSAHPQWGAYASRLTDPNSMLWRDPPGGGHNDKAHPPIHPTKFTRGEPNWSQKQKKVYELVVRHFLACCSERAVGSESVIKIDICGEKFSSRGVTIKQRNWLDVYPYSNWNQAGLPNLQVGQTFEPHEVSLKDGQTRPPEKLKETDLIAKMEEHGIGTDATMAQHIETTLNRGYAIRDEQTMQFIPTPLGEALVYAYKEMDLDDLWQPFLRADTEMQVSNIACGRVTKSAVVQEAIVRTKTQFLKALPQLAVLERSIGHFFTRKAGGVNNNNSAAAGGGAPEEHQFGQILREHCPLCAQSVVLRNSRNSKYIAQCSNHPGCNHKIYFPKAAVQVTVLPERCPRCPLNAGVFLLDLRFRRAALPPGYSTEMQKQCVYCSSSVKDLFEACGCSNRNLTGGPHQQQQRNNVPSSGSGRAYNSNNNNQQQPPRYNNYPPSSGGPTSHTGAGNRNAKRRQAFEGSRRVNGRQQQESHTTFVSATGERFPLQDRQHQYSSSNQNQNQAQDTCYKCGGVGHWASNCPNKRQR